MIDTDGNEVPELELYIDKCQIDTDYKWWEKGDVLYWKRGNKMELFGKLLEDINYESNSNMGYHTAKVRRWKTSEITDDDEYYEKHGKVRKPIRPPVPYTEKPILNRIGLYRVKKRVNYK